MAGKTPQKVVLITGASSGIGYEIARGLAGQGHRVYGGARRVERMEPLRARGVTPLALDVTDPDSCEQAVTTVIEREGRIDVLVNNAGYGSYGAVEDVTIDEARRQVDVNVFSVATLVKAVMPHMRAQHSGRIINISSMGGRLVTFLGGWYHATKYALEALSDALRMEVRQFGVDVVLVEPGGIRTDWGRIAADNLVESARGGAYEADAVRTAEAMRRMYGGSMMSDPKVVVRAVAKAVSSRRPRARYLVGFGARPLVAAHAVLPARAFDRLITRAGG